MKRRIWGDRQPISGADLSDIGIYTEAALGNLGLTFSSGRLSGLTLSPTAPATASVLIAPGSALVYDAGVARMRLADLTESASLSFTGRATGTYAVVLSATEVGSDERTIIPPPLGHPFYEASAQPYQLQSVRQWTLTVTAQAAPYTPAGAQVVLGTVNWSGSAVTVADINPTLGAPTPNMPAGSVTPEKLSAALAGAALERGGDGALNVRVDEVGVTVTGGKLSLKAGGATDAVIGTRSLGSVTLPDAPTQAAPLGTLLSWLAQALTRTQGTASWVQAPPTSVTALHGRVGALEGQQGVIADGAVTDPKIGTRTADDTLAPSGPSGLLGTLLSGLANRLKAITGEAGWTVNPATTLKELHANVTRKGADEAVSGAWRFTQPLRVPAPSDDAHAVNRAHLESRISAVTSGQVTVGSVVGLQTALDAKSGVGHGHAFADLTGKPTTLAGYGITDGGHYDLAGFNPGRPQSGEALLMFVAPRTVTLEASAPGAARARVAASALTVFAIMHDSTAQQIGAVTFAAGSASGVVTLNATVALAPGQSVSVVAPVARDATLADVAVTLAGRV